MQKAHAGSTQGSQTHRQQEDCLRLGVGAVNGYWLQFYKMKKKVLQINCKITYTYFTTTEILNYLKAKLLDSTCLLQNLKYHIII